MDALVLAGGTSRGLSADESVSTKALIDINNRPMLDYILDALRDSHRIEKIIVVLPSSVQSIPCLDKVDVVIKADGNLAENFYAGLKGLDSGKFNSNNKVLAVSADIPLLTSEAVRDFLDRCERREASVYYPILSKATIESKYPKVERTYMILREGKFTGGNLILFNPRVAVENEEIMKKISKVRKSLFKLVQILGVRFIIKFMFHLLTVEELEEKISDVIGARGVAVNTPYVEISVDVDKMSDLELVRAKLEKEKLNLEKDHHN